MPLDEPLGEVGHVRMGGVGEDEVRLLFGQELVVVGVDRAVGEAGDQLQLAGQALP